MLLRSRIGLGTPRIDRGSAELSLVSVAQLDQIPSDRGLRVEVDGIAIGLYRVGDAVYAMEDACPHAGVALSKGSLEGCVITCRAHGWPFDVRTGFDPAHEDGFPIPCFAVELRDGEVFVDLAVRVNQRRPARR